MKLKTNLKAGLPQGEYVKSSSRNFLQAAAMSLSPVLVVLSLMLTAPRPAHAITWCHDYVYSVISGGQDMNNLSAQELRDALQSRGYVWVRTLPPGAKDSSYLRDGDVLIFDEAHSGIVVDEYGRINHFLQKYQHSKVPYMLAEARSEWDFILNQPLLRRKWTLQQIREENIPPFQPPYINAWVQVWRPGPKQLMLDWTKNALCDPACTFIYVSGWGLVPISDPDLFFIPVANTLEVSESNGWSYNWMQFAVIYWLPDGQFLSAGDVWLCLATYTGNTSIRWVKVCFPDNSESGWKQAYDLHRVW